MAKLNVVTIFAIVVILSGMLADGLKCWVCNDAKNGWSCRRKGHATECEANQMCFTELRLENNQFRRTSHCKQKDACALFSSEDQERCPAFSNRFDKGPDCKGEGCTPRLCRSCCWWSDLCNKPKFVPKQPVDEKPKGLQPALLIALSP